jgi:hypothetical protein
VTDALESVLRAYADRNVPQLVSLGGLPQSPPLSRITAALGADPGVFVRWFLGDPPIETFWCPAMVDGFSRVKIWFRADTVVKLEGEYPEIEPAAADPIGAPELQLDYPLDIAAAPGGERVWASRGLAMKLSMSGTVVVALTVFAPTTPAGYRRSIRDDAEYREAPAPGAGEATAP